jgi:regulator of protease activity HflC (stomatin/prohibitin superfamily)
MSDFINFFAVNIFWLLFFPCIAFAVAIFIARKRFWRIHVYLHEHSIELTIFALIVVFLVVFFARDMFVTIPSGRVGVLWQRFNGGTQTCSPPLEEGMHVIMPWNKIDIYDLRIQLRDEKLDVLSSDGLNLEIDVVYRFELVKQNIPVLNKFVGPDYITTLIAPEVAADARNIFGHSTPDEIYAGRRDRIQNDIRDAVNKNLLQGFNPLPGDIKSCNPLSPATAKAAAGADKDATQPSSTVPSSTPVQYAYVEDVLARSITLPPAVEAAINSKNEEAQRNEEYAYRILREEKEAERKRAEATGIRDFENIIMSGSNFRGGFDDGYLRWLGIQATLELAKSPNAKVVIVGDGKGGLPIILGDSGASGPANVSKAPPPAGLETPPIASLEQQLNAGAAGLPGPVASGG